MQPLIRPSDIAALLFLSAHPGEPYGQMAAVLGLSKSTAHKAVSRLIQLGLAVKDDGGRIHIEAEQAIELLRVIRYVFPSVQTEKARGVPTGLAALTAVPSSLDNIVTMVWPSRLGSAVGVGVQPLIPNAPDIAFRDPKLYRLMAIVDALRLGDARDREAATVALQKALVGHAENPA
jgi:hypothetical protein